MTKIDKIDLENISLIKKNLKLKNIASIKIKKGNYEIEISSSPNNSMVNISPSNLSENSHSVIKESKEVNINSENFIKSPMVGVAYLSADPSTPSYVKLGQRIKEGETLMLIEAMKTFNEVKAPRSGIIKKIIVLNNQPIEFGDDLFILE